MDPNSGTAGKRWYRLVDGCIECAFCPHLCKLRQGEIGLCRMVGRPDAALRGDCGNGCEAGQIQC